MRLRWRILKLGLPKLCVALTVSVLALAANQASAQELEPALYRNAPVGLNAIGVSYGHSGGNVLVDSALPLEDVEGSLDLVMLAYVRTLDFFGLSAKIDASIPYVWGGYEGLVDGEFRTRDLVGWGDPRFRFAVNLFGAPALDVKEFARYRQKTIVGAEIQVTAPAGKYEPDRFFNLGANRWAFRPEIGMSREWRRWYFELAGGGLFFTTNDDFFGGRTLQQNPFYSIKGHIIRGFRPGLWLAFNFGYGRGGEIKVDGEQSGNIQSNVRLGCTLAIPLRPGNALRVIYASGVRTRFGADFDALAVVYQYTWGGKGRPRS